MEGLGKKFFVVLLIGIFMMSMVSAVWWNPFTWFDDDENVIIKNGGWYLDHIDGIQFDNFDTSVENLENGKAKICLLPKTELSITDPIVKDSKATLRKNNIETGIIQPADMETENAAGKLVKMCIDVDASTENYARFGSNSALFIYTNESITVTEEGEEIGRLTLTTPDIIFKNEKPNIKTGTGKDLLTHTFYIENYSTTSITNLRSVDMRNGMEVERNINLKFLSYEDQEVETYDYSNTTTSNETIIQTQFINGTKNISIEKWINMDLAVEGEDYVIGIFADAYDGDYMDADFDYYGISVASSPINWATWTADLNTDLIVYYKLDEASGNALDSINSNDITESGTVPSSSGLIGTSRGTHSSSNYFQETVTDISVGTDVPFTANMWVYMNSLGTSSGFFTIKSPDSVNDLHGGLEITSSNLLRGYMAKRGDTPLDFTNSHTLSVDEWTMVTLILRADRYVELCVDTICTTSSSAMATGSDSDSDRITIGKSIFGTYFTTGKIDEVGVWERVLTSDEIDDLYNSRNGITWTDEFGKAPAVTLTSPINTTNYTASNTVNFEYSCTDAINLHNCTLYVNDVAEYINTSGFNGTYQYSTGFEDGLYNWSVEGWNNQSLNNMSDTWFFNVSYITGIDITINTPTDNANFTTNQITFNADVTDNYGIENVSLFIDGVLNATDTSQTNGTYQWIRDLADGYHSWYLEVYDNDSNGVNSSTYNFEIDTTPFIEFLTPPTLINYANVSQSYVPMKVNVSTPYFENITYSLRNINGTNYTQFYTNQTYDINFTSVPDGHYHYDVTVCTTTNQCNVTETRHINHDVTAPEINLTSPTGIFDYLIENTTLNLNWTVLDDQDNIDSCWYVYDSVTTPISCSLNTTVFNYSNNKNSMVFYVNDTFGNEANQTATWDFIILDIDQTYTTPVTEGTPNTITKKLKIVGSLDSAILDYNGTNYTTTSNFDGENYTFSSTVVAPLVDNNENITFKLFVIVEGVYYETIETTQLIQSINFSVCTVGDVLLNLFLLDEEEKTELFGEIEVNAQLISQISGNAVEVVLDEVNNTSNLSICLDPISSVSNFYLDVDIVYSSDNYAKEFYFIRNAELSAIPINVSLFDLSLNQSTEFLLRYQGQTLTKVEGAIIQLQRYYVSSGASEAVEAPLTSISGTAIAHIDLNTVKYSATVVKDGVILDIFNDIAFDCENELSGQCTQNLYADVTPYNTIDSASLNDFAYVISDTGEKLITTFSIPSGSTKPVNVVMTQRDQFGDTESCNKTITTSSGSLECSYNKTIGDSYLFLEITKDGEQQAQKEYFVPESNDIDWGGLNWLVMFILLISLAFMAISSPEWIVGNSVITFIIGGGLWLVEGMNIVAGLGLLLWLLVAAILLILEMAKQEDR